MKGSEYEYKYRTNYIAQKYTRIPVSYPNDFADEVKRAAAEQNLAIAAYVRQAIEMKMEADGFQRQSASTKYAIDEEGNRMLVETTCNGVLIRKTENGWLNTVTNQLYRTMAEARKSAE